MATVIRVPVKRFRDGRVWLLLEEVLGRRVVLRAHEIDLKRNVEDYDAHHGPEAHAKGSVKCCAKADAWDLSPLLYEA
jgi:hypothetical protein